MKTCGYIFLAFSIALASAAEEASTPTNVQDYLKRKLRETKVNIAKSYTSDPPLASAPTYDVQWVRLWEKPVDSDHALALSFSDDTFVLANDRVLSVELELVSEVVKLHQVAVISQQKAAKFVRTIAWRESLYLLICQEDGSCHLHVGPNMNELGHRQILKYSGLPMDAEFFTQTNRLYLVVAHNSGQFSVPSVIYHWTGTYMDVIAKVTTTGAVSVTTFNHRQSTILIFAQNVQGQPRIGSEVFKFKNGLVEKIQFLATDAPISVHHYQYKENTFLLVINELSASKVLWWDGKEFLNWMELPEIKSPNQVSVVYVAGDTLLLVSQQNTLSLYRMMKLAYTKLDLLDMKNKSTITDFNARVKGNSIILVLVTKSEGNSYRVEPIELVVKKFDQEHPFEEADRTWQYLTQLSLLLNERMPAVQEAHDFWPSLFPSSENIVITSPLELEDFAIDSGTVSDLFLSSSVDILTPTELASGLEQLNPLADSLISRSSEFLYSNSAAELIGRVVVQGDAFFDEMHVDSINVSVLNDQRVELDGVFSYTKDQEFSGQLRGSVVTIEDLEIDSLCGVPFKYWLMANSADQTALDFFADNANILHDTILVQSDLSLDNLGVSVLNNLDLESFVRDLFIVGLNQQINGSIFYKRGLSADHLTIGTLNDMGADQLLTKTTDQELGDVLIKSLDIEDLFVETINNVSVNEAARISQENVVSGQVTFRSLRITEELAVEGVSVLFDIRPIQLYNTVEINGDLVINELVSNPESSLRLNDAKVDVDSLFMNYWTKSTDQTIPYNITLARGITIDDLHAGYLNGYDEDDFLYTTATEIPEKFGALHFKRLEIDGLLLAGDRELAESLATEDTLIVNQKIHIADLKVSNLNAQTYNRIPIHDIVGGKIGVKIPGTVKYENLTVKNGFRAGEVLVKFLNNRDLTGFFEKALLIDKNYEIEYLELKELETSNFQVEEMNGLKMLDFYRMLKFKDITAIKNVTVNGDLRVNGDLKVEFINEMSSADFVKRLSNDDIELNGVEILDRFVVFGNLSANLLGGIKIEDLVANTLSKTKAQRITGQYSFRKVQTDDFIAEEINGFNVSKLKLVSDPLIIEGDLNFSDLFVHGDIITGLFNGFDVGEIYEGALQVPFTRIANLTVTGNIAWEKSAMELKSLSYLFDSAVTKNTDQTITAEVVFADCVCAFHLTCEKGIGDVDVAGIVLDAVIPFGPPITINGRKVLAKGLTAGRLTVSGNIDVPEINGWNILDLNSTIVRKFDTQTVSGATIFRKDVTVERLQVAGKVHGLPTKGIATFFDRLPSNTRFTVLEVQKQLQAKKLDGIDFEEFIKNRVTLNGIHHVHNDVIFQDPVVVTQNAVLPSINEIAMSEVVVSGTKDAQLISSEKTFLTDLVVHGNVEVDKINDIVISEEYKNGVLNNEDVYIEGNIIFSADFETLSNVSVSGLVNDVELSQFSKDLHEQSEAMIAHFGSDQSSVDRMIDRSLNYSKFLPDIFFYLDTQDELVLRAPNIHKVKTLAVESMTKLNLYGTEEGEPCGLPNFCPCPTQYVAELLDYEWKIWKIDGSRTVYNAHDSAGRFALNIVSDTVSSSANCVRENFGTEFTTVSWMTPWKLATGHIAGEIRNGSAKIPGYLGDVQTFTIGEKLYVILAIYFDALLKSHDVSSLLYEIDPNSNDMKLAQSIRTSGAVALDVFATELHGMHLLIACEKDPAESQLHRFNMRDSKFELLRTFRTGGTRNVKSIIQGEESFVLLDDPLANSVHIFNYKVQFDNYYFYQSLYHESRVKNIEVFYSGEFGASDAHVIVTTEEGRFFIYEYIFFGGFQLRAQEWIDGVQTMTPFLFSQRRYVFVGTVTNSTVYRIVQQGPNYS